MLFGSAETFVFSFLTEGEDLAIRSSPAPRTSRRPWRRWV